MASEVQLLVVGDGSTDTCRQTTFDLLQHLEARWSRFLPHSDISRLNGAGGDAVRVDPSTITLITTMIDAWHATEQRFDPTTLRALVAAGYSASIDDPRRVTVLPSGQVLLGERSIDPSAPIEGGPTLDQVEIDRDHCTVRLPDGLALDAGGIGKGLAADLAVAHALRSGADGALVSIGGDVSAGGRSPDDGWAVLIESPDPAHRAVGCIALDAGGVATSSTRSRRWQRDGREHHHVIDPWTGAPSTTDLASTTVIARSGWLAEAHATAALLARSSDVIDYLDRHQLSGLAVTGDACVLATDDLAELRRGTVATSNMGASR